MQKNYHFNLLKEIFGNFIFHEHLMDFFIKYPGIHLNTTLLVDDKIFPFFFQITCAKNIG